MSIFRIKAVESGLWLSFHNGAVLFLKDASFAESWDSFEAAQVVLDALARSWAGPFCIVEGTR